MSGCGMDLLPRGGDGDAFLTSGQPGISSAPHDQPMSQRMWQHIPPYLLSVGQSPDDAYALSALSSLSSPRPAVPLSGPISCLLSPAHHNSITPPLLQSTAGPVSYTAFAINATPATDNTPQRWVHTVHRPQPRPPALPVVGLPHPWIPRAAMPSRDGFGPAGPLAYDSGSFASASLLPTVLSTLALNVCGKCKPEVYRIMSNLRYN